MQPLALTFVAMRTSVRLACSDRGHLGLFTLAKKTGDIGILS